MKASQFALKDKDGKIVSLSEIKSAYTVLYFYPKDNTPGCTIESKDFSKTLPEFKKLDTTVIGISGGDEKSKTKFCTKHNLAHILLSDTDFAVSKAYKSFGKKKFMGREYEGISRNTFILDRDKNIIHTYEKVNPLGHAKEVMKFISLIEKR